MRDDKEVGGRETKGERRGVSVDGQDKTGA